MAISQFNSVLLFLYTAEGHTRDDVFREKQIYNNDRYDCYRDHHIDFTHIKVHVVCTPKRCDQNRNCHLVLGLDHQRRNEVIIP